MKSTALPLLLAMYFMAPASQSFAVSDREAQAIQLAITAADKTTYTFGTLRHFVARMKTLGQTCDASPYDYGIDIACNAPQQEPMVYLRFDAEPGPNPRVAYLGGLRVKGRNGGEAPADQWLSFVTTFTHITPKPADF